MNEKESVTGSDTPGAEVEVASAAGPDAAEIGSEAGEVNVDATPTETRAEIAKFVPRGYSQIRHVLVQKPEEPRPSVVGRAVHERKHRALVLYLMLLNCWPWLENSREPLSSGAWIRALTWEEPHVRALTWSPSTLSRAWADLEKMGLIERNRKGKLLEVRPNREDGEDIYSTPGGRRDRLSKYFTLPTSFWNEGYFAKLSLPGLAALLIVAKETSNDLEMWVRFQDGPKWYGISPKTLQNGINDLEKHGLLHKRAQKIKAPLSKTGSTTRMWYSLTGDFGYTARKAAQANAAKARSENASISIDPAAPVGVSESALEPSKPGAGKS
ncbi:helix-turn-helix transcriptional regulator [Rhodococcus qingshengii]|uniref:helix-turn-helix transcriptional regulator n=1 Tax=Rhodococcus qingshengii TaxID=334542 RepID=UPI0030D1E8E2